MAVAGRAALDLPTGPISAMPSRAGEPSLARRAGVGLPAVGEMPGMAPVAGSGGPPVPRSGLVPGVDAMPGTASGVETVPGPLSGIGGPRPSTDPVARPETRRPAEPVGDGFYRTRRPGVAVLLVIAVAVLELPALRLLLDGAVAGTPAPAKIVSGMFLAIGLPLSALGMYGMATGAGRLPGQAPAHTWFRPPVGYLAVGLVLFIAAGLAA